MASALLFALILLAGPLVTHTSGEGCLSVPNKDFCAGNKCASNAQCVNFYGGYACMCVSTTTTQPSNSSVLRTTAPTSSTRPLTTTAAVPKPPPRCRDLSDGCQTCVFSLESTLISCAGVRCEPPAPMLCRTFYDASAPNGTIMASPPSTTTTTTASSPTSLPPPTTPTTTASPVGFPSICEFVGINTRVTFGDVMHVDSSDPVLVELLPQPSAWTVVPSKHWSSVVGTDFVVPRTDLPDMQPAVLVDLKRLGQGVPIYCDSPALFDVFVHLNKMQGASSDVRIVVSTPSARAPSDCTQSVVSVDASLPPNTEDINVAGGGSGTAVPLLVNAGTYDLCDPSAKRISGVVSISAPPGSRSLLPFDGVSFVRRTPPKTSLVCDNPFDLHADAVSWSALNLPTSGDVIIPEGVSVLVQGHLQVNKITVLGALVFDTTPGSSVLLEVNDLTVTDGGSVHIGSELCPLNSAAILRVNGTIELQRGATFAAHAPVIRPGTWVSLSRGVLPSSNVVCVNADVRGWLEFAPHPLIVISSTDFDETQTEVRMVMGVSPDGLCITLDRPLFFPHNCGSSYGVSECGEVALLTRSIQFQSSSESSVSTFKVAPGVRQFALAGAKLQRFGGRGTSPIQLDNVGAVATSVVRQCAFSNSRFGCVEARDAQLFSLSANVAYNIVGACFSLPSGLETGVVVRDNIVINMLSAGGQAPPSSVLPPASWESQSVSDEVAFYITNPKNIVTGNVAVGARIGFLLSFSLSPVDGTLQAPAFISLQDFSENTAHTCHESGFVVMNHEPRTRGLVENPLAVNVYSKLTSYKNRMYGIRVHGMALQFSTCYLANNLIGIALTSYSERSVLPDSANQLIDSFVVGDSFNLGVPRTRFEAAVARSLPDPMNRAPPPTVGVAFGGNQRTLVSRTQFAAFRVSSQGIPLINGTLVREAGAFSWEQSAWPREELLVPDPTNEVREVRFTFVDQMVHMFSERNVVNMNAVLVDPRGALSGRAPSAVVGLSPFLSMEDLVCTRDSKVSKAGRICDLSKIQYARFTMDRLASEPREVLVRGSVNGTFTALGGVSLLVNTSASMVVRSNAVFKVEPAKIQAPLLSGRLLLVDRLQSTSWLRIIRDRTEVGPVTKFWNLTNNAPLDHQSVLDLSLLPSPASLGMQIAYAEAEDDVVFTIARSDRLSQDSIGILETPRSTEDAFCGDGVCDIGEFSPRFVCPDCARMSLTFYFDSRLPPPTPEFLQALNLSSTSGVRVITEKPVQPGYHATVFVRSTDAFLALRSRIPLDGQVRFFKDNVVYIGILSDRLNTTAGTTSSSSANTTRFPTTQASNTTSNTTSTKLTTRTTVSTLSTSRTTVTSTTTTTTTTSTSTISTTTSTVTTTTTATTTSSTTSTSSTTTTTTTTTTSVTATTSSTTTTTITTTTTTTLATTSEAPSTASSPSTSDTTPTTTTSTTTSPTPLSTTLAPTTTTTTTTTSSTTTTATSTTTTTSTTSTASSTSTTSPSTSTTTTLTSTARTSGTTTIDGTTASEPTTSPRTKSTSASPPNPSGSTVPTRTSDKSTVEGLLPTSPGSSGAQGSSTGGDAQKSALQIIVGVIAAAFVLVLIVVFTLVRKKRRIARLADPFLEDVKVTDMMNVENGGQQDPQHGAGGGFMWDEDGSSPPSGSTVVASSVPQTVSSPVLFLEGSESDFGGSEGPSGDLFTRLLGAVSCNDSERLRLFLGELDTASSPGSSPGVVPMEQSRKPHAMLSQTDVSGNTLLAWAVRLGFEESVRLLLEAGSSANTVNLQGHRPIHMACMSRPNLEIVRMLVRAGAKANVPDFEGTSAFLYACRSGNQAVVELLLPTVNLFNTDNRNMTPLMLAACFGHTSVVDSILSSTHGEELVRLLNWQDVRGWTALHWTVSVGELMCAERIMREPGLDICVRNMFGESVLHLACREDEPALTMLLLNDQYVKPRPLLLKFVTLTTEEGYTALQYAKQAESTRCADFVEDCIRSLCHEWRSLGKAWLGSIVLPKPIVDKYLHGIEEVKLEAGQQLSPSPEPAARSLTARQAQLQKRKVLDEEESLTDSHGQPSQESLLHLSSMDLAIGGAMGAALQLPVQGDLLDPFSSTSEDAGTMFGSPFSPGGFSPEDIFSFPSVPVAGPIPHGDSGLSFSSLEDSIDEKEEQMTGTSSPISEMASVGAAPKGASKAAGKSKQVKRRRRKVNTEGVSATEAARRERRREAWHQKQEEERVYVERLQKQVMELETENKKLSSSMQMMQAESKRLKFLVTKC